ALLGGDRPGVGLNRVLVAVGELRGGNRRHHEARTEPLRELAEEARAKARDVWCRLDTRFRELGAPELRVPRLRLRQLQEQILAQWIGLGRGDGGVERGAVELVAKIRLIAPDGGTAVRRFLGRARPVAGRQRLGLLRRRRLRSALLEPR